MLLQAQVRQLQIQDPRMLYFLTYTIYFVDKYNVIYGSNKYLIEYFCYRLTNDSKYLYKGYLSLQT
jgi:hypothetical protein